MERKAPKRYLANFSSILNNQANIFGLIEQINEKWVGTKHRRHENGIRRRRERRERRGRRREKQKEPI